MNKIMTNVLFSHLIVVFLHHTNKTRKEKLFEKYYGITI